MSSKQKLTEVNESRIPLMGNASINGQATAKRNTVTFTLTTNFKIQIPLTVTNVFLSILNVICQVGLTVSLPLFTTALGAHQACGVYGKAIAGPYFVLFFTTLWYPVVFFAGVLVAKLLNGKFSLQLNCSMGFVILLGFLNAVKGVFIVYASPSDRTPQFLQPILSSSIIPFTVVLRYLILRKGLSGGRLVSTFIVLVGLVICLEPTIFQLGQGNKTTSNRAAVSIVWPMIYCIGYIPFGLINVIQEREVKKRLDSKRCGEVHSLLFQAWFQLFSFIFIAAMFFLDFIPHFGASANFDEFSQNMCRGWNCELGHAPKFNCSPTDPMPHDPYGPDAHCSILIGRTWYFIIFYCLSNLFGLMLIKYAEGAVYLVIVNALITPVGTFFLTLFQLESDTGKFYWKPEVDVATWYALAGVCLMVPAVVWYNYLGIKEQREKEEK
ncbi:crt homolog 2-like [Oscarella lobularis]|uniref:crt homolog 2-like n=1 Tax=Oscarella lobularis TaxID=121494 RepID=UPI0033136FFF